MPSSEIVIDRDAGTIKYPQWVRRGMMQVNRDYLDHDDPDQTWNYLTRHGIDPAEYGVKNPLAEEFNGKSRSQLIQEILDLRRELESMHRSGFF